MNLKEKLAEKFADLTKEPNFFFIDLVLCGLMLAGTLIVWLCVGGK